MPDPALSGSEFKKQLQAGQPKMGLFLNAHSPTVAEQLAHSGYDWLLVDTQHGPRRPCSSLNSRVPHPCRALCDRVGLLTFSVFLSVLCGEFFLFK